jgi:hypothetical protein
VGGIAIYTGTSLTEYVGNENERALFLADFGYPTNRSL